MIRIVTDSSSDISPHLAAELGITVIPIRINFGTRVYYDGVDLNRPDFYSQLARQGALPNAEPPSPEEFHRIYSRLLQGADQILSIHVSSKLNNTVQIARDAAKAFLGRDSITVMDSRLASWGLEILVTTAAEAVQKGLSIEEVVRLIRGMIPHIYMVFFVENLDYLERRRGWNKNRKFTDGLLGVRPLLIMEDGEIMPMEKVRTRGKAVDRLFEFVAEFARFERVMVLQGRRADEARLLFERLIDVFPEKRLGIKSYGPALATHLGPDALGVVVYEGM